MYAFKKNQWNPFHPHCGPGNDIDEVPPEEGTVDRICYDHDVSYGDVPWYKQGFTESDERFINQMDTQSGILPRLYATIFRIKKVVVPGSTRDKHNLNFNLKYTTRQEGKSISYIENMAYNRKRKRSNSYSGKSNKRKRMNLMNTNFVDGPFKVDGTEKYTQGYNTSVSPDVMWHCNKVKQDTTISGRIGKKILMKELQVNGKIWNGTSADAVKVRVIVFYDKRPGTVFPAHNEVLTDDDSYEFFKNDNRSRFVILKDWNQLLCGNFTSVNANDTFAKNINFKIKLNKITEFGTGVEGTVSETETGALYVMAVTDQPSEAEKEPTVKIRTRLRYVDIMG